ncbi:MAG: helix-turn-helix transcriptional regulator [Elusimicrobia bacterium]|nr:helix-turn-helix transcriptional regulator [Elusimicrobiota bacterium]
MERTLPFAEMVRRRMESRGLGLREFCRGVDLDPSFFSKVLAGKRSPPSEDDVLRRIARFLELDACELIVAAGRIPREWDRLWTDRPLLEAVSRLCAPGIRRTESAAPAAVRPPPRAQGLGPRAQGLGPRAPAPKAFGDELL